MDSLCHAIVHKGVITSRKAKWITFQVGDIRLGLLSLYDHYNTSGSVEFSIQIINALQITKNLFILICLRTWVDKVGGSHITVHGNELATLERLCMVL